jgi:hypothetical protein
MMALNTLGMRRGAGEFISTDQRVWDLPDVPTVYDGL